VPPPDDPAVPKHQLHRSPEDREKSLRLGGRQPRGAQPFEQVSLALDPLGRLGEVQVGEGGKRRRVRGRQDRIAWPCY